MYRLTMGAVSAAAVITLAPSACAQIAEPYQPVSPDSSADDVLSRSQSEFNPVGGRLGSFFLYPRLNVETAYADNVLGTSNDKKGDGYVIARGDIQFVSNWSRHGLEILAYGQTRRDFSVTSENTQTYGAALNGRYDVNNDTSIEGSFHADKQPVDRLGVDNTTFTYNPLQFLMLNNSIQAKTRLGSFNLQGGVQVVKLSYDNAFGPSGFIDETGLDNTRILYQGSARYNITHSTALIFAGQYDTIDYRSSPLGDRNSSGYRLESGIGLRITHSIVGDVRVGYLHRNNENPVYPDLSGFSFYANLAWTPTRLLSVRMTANRDIENSVTLNSPGNLRSTAQIRASYELMRQLIVTPGFRFSRVTAIGIGGSNNEEEATLQAVYRFNRQFSLTGKYRYFNRSAGLYQPVEGSIISLGLALTL